MSRNDLSKVLVAAHFPKRVSKKLVEETNICLSVDKILGQFAVVTYRVLGYYVIGLTRIHSMKVKYLLDDCNRSCNDLEFFSKGRKKLVVNYGGMCLPESTSKRSQVQPADADAQESSRRKSSYSFVESIRAQCGSLSLPDCSDLDSYNLDVVLDDISNDHVKPHLELVLKDTWEDQRRVCHASASTSTSTMPRNVESDASVEKFMHRFFLEERLDPMVLSVSDDELILDSAPLVEHEHEPESKTNNDIELSMISEGVKSCDMQPDDEDGTTNEPTVVPEMASVDNLLLQPSADKSQMSATVNVTPMSRASVATGKPKPRSVAVRTPGSKTDLRVPRKRKCVSDDATMVPEEVYTRTRASEVRDLGRKRRTRTEVSEKKDKHRSFDHFMQPRFSIFPHFQADLSSVIPASVRVVVEQGEETVCPTESKGDESKQVAVEVVEEAVGPTMSGNNGLGPLNVHMVSEETEAEGIAPLTPATQSALLKFDEVGETSMVSEMGPATSSCESQERMMSPTRDEIQTAEGPSTLGEGSNQENVLVAEKLSAATKSVGSFLHGKFVHSKEKGEEEAVNLSQILKKKTKQESAMVFYQILVLKTGGYVDVKQEKPYDEICLKQTEKMTAAFEDGGGNLVSRLHYQVVGLYFRLVFSVTTVNKSEKSPLKAVIINDKVLLAYSGSIEIGG
ncbi:sister chromatid cohesion 1 protein 2-like [Bidens hawaiensis]|uniref:sister chromatid cohesion 1 protein 2-like n=1 Tax=Bidens hawaiensis TaxID=980011 RepID=UPI0040495FEC